MAASDGPIRSHSTKTSEDDWHGSRAESMMGGAAPQTMRRAFAWVDPQSPDENKTSYKFIHHEVDSNGRVGPANMRACINAIGVLNGGRRGADIPKAHRRGVYNHLAKHMRDAGHEPPPLEE
jgi:hypothetical protein